jgi:hypothetical protein
MVTIRCSIPTTSIGESDGSPFGRHHDHHADRM